MTGQRAAGFGRLKPSWRGAIRLAVMLALPLAGPTQVQAQAPVATTTEVRREPLPVTNPSPPVPMVPAVSPPPSVPMPTDWERGQELYHQAHDAIAAGQPELANRLFEAACRLYERRSCFNTGLALETRASQPGAEVSLRAAAQEAYRTACQHDFQRGCVAAARLLLDPKWGQQDPLQAIGAFERACRRGEAEGCELQADLYNKGEGVSVDLARAARLYKQACDAANRPNSCFNFGLMAERGRGLAQNEQVGLHYYRLACRAGSLAGCHNLAVNYAEKSKAPDRLVLARNLLKQGCNRNYLASCTTFGQFIREYEKPADNYAEAVAALTKACNGKDGLACRILGNMAHDRIGLPGGNQAANRLYDRSCKLGYGEGCYNLGLAYWSGYRVKANAETAMAWFGEGCRLRSASSCVGAYLATLNLPADHPLAGQDMARRWLAQGAAIEPGNNLVKTVQEAYESRGNKPELPGN